MKISTAAATLGGLAVIGLVVVAGFAGGHEGTPAIEAAPAATGPSTVQTEVAPRTPQVPASSHPESSTARSVIPSSAVPAPAVETPAAAHGRPTAGHVVPNSGAAAVPPPVLSPADYRRPASSIPAAGDADALAQCSAAALTTEVPPWTTAVERQLIVDNALRQCLAYYQR